MGALIIIIIIDILVVIGLFWFGTKPNHPASSHSPHPSTPPAATGEEQK